MVMAATVSQLPQETLVLLHPLSGAGLPGAFPSPSPRSFSPRLVGTLLWASDILVGSSL